MFHLSEGIECDLPPDQTAVTSEAVVHNQWGVNPSVVPPPANRTAWHWANYSVISGNVVQAGPAAGGLI